MMRTAGVGKPSKGFSLIEVLVATVVIVIVLVGCLGCLTGALGVQQRARRQADLAVEKWNESRQFRERTDRGDPVRPAPDLSPLRRGLVGGDESDAWEVLHHD